MQASARSPPDLVHSEPADSASLRQRVCATVALLVLVVIQLECH